MKKVLLLSFVILLGTGFSLQAQKIHVPIKKKATEKTNEEIDKSIDKGLNKLFGKKKKKNKSGESPAGTQSHEGSKNIDAGTAESKKATAKAWTKYDFVPGDVIIFQDNQENEQNGEFPSKWDLKEGNVEIARLGDDFVINFATIRGCRIVPLMKETGDYLPDKFTVEFDVFFSEFCTRYTVYLYDVVNQKELPENHFISISPNEVHVEGFGSTEWGAVPDSDYPFWKHVSISFNTRALKVYYGEKRGANIPNLRVNPTGITVFSRQCHQGYQAMIKNIRIAKGSKNLYDRVVTDGKFITTGIRFDSGESTIRPESAGTLKQIFNMMQEHPDLKFSIEGHTDNVGDADFNQKLSEERAAAVKTRLVEMGIDAGRMETKGWGENNPIDNNNTPEGRANNRRVEFVKM